MACSRANSSSEATDNHLLGVIRKFQQIDPRPSRPPGCDLSHNPARKLTAGEVRVNERRINGSRKLSLCCRFGCGSHRPDGVLTCWSVGWSRSRFDRRPLGLDRPPARALCSTLLDTTAIWERHRRLPSRGRGIRPEAQISFGDDRKLFAIRDHSWVDHVSLPVGAVDDASGYGSASPGTASFIGPV